MRPASGTLRVQLQGNISVLPSSFRDGNVCVLGLGYVGLTLAVAMADSGFQVHGLEVRDDVLDGLTNDRPHFWEPQLTEKLKRVRQAGRFTFSKALAPEVKASVYIITVGTPLGADGKAQLQSVSDATRQICDHCEDGALIILRSTVKLGTARNVVSPILDATGREYEIAVCPERTLEGKALIELHELPQIIGSDSPDTRARCAQLFGILTPTAVRLHALESAELVKLVDNTYRDVTFGFANEIAKLCAGIGISAQEVIRAGRLGYPRTNVAWPGPVGGPCLEKDPHILFESAASVGVEMAITRAARLTNEEQPGEVAQRLRIAADATGAFPATPQVRLLGLAFKGVPATDDLRGTMAKPMIDGLDRAFPGAVIGGYDAVAEHGAIEDYFGFAPKRSLEDAFKGADLVVIANNHPSLQAIDLGAYAEHMNRPGLIFDYWNMHDAARGRLPDGIRYMGLGSESQRSEMF